MDDKYFKLYLKYKSKYLAAKKELQNNQFGGEKRFLKKQEKNQDALLLTPIGESNNSMQSILLEPEVNFIVNKCSKNKLKCEKKNAQILNGYQMLVHQALKSWNIWNNSINIE